MSTTLLPPLSDKQFSYTQSKEVHKLNEEQLILPRSNLSEVFGSNVTTKSDEEQSVSRSNFSELFNSNSTTDEKQFSLHRLNFSHVFVSNVSTKSYDEQLSLPRLNNSKKFDAGQISLPQNNDVKTKLNSTTVTTPIPSSSLSSQSSQRSESSTTADASQRSESSTTADTPIPSLFPSHSLQSPESLTTTTAPILSSSLPQSTGATLIPSLSLSQSSLRLESLTTATAAIPEFDLPEAVHFNANHFVSKERQRMKTYIMSSLKSVDCGSFECNLEHHQKPLVIKN